MKSPIIKINDMTLSKEDCVTFINALNSLERELRLCAANKSEMNSIQRIWKCLSKEID